MRKADNIFVKAKAYRKEHPRISFQDAIKKVSGKKVSGAKKITGAKKVKVAGTRKRTTKPAKVGTSRPAANKSIGRIDKGHALVKQIDQLERKRKAIKNKELRDIYAFEINGIHKRLNQLKRA